MVIFHSFLYVYQAGYGWVYWHWLKLGYLKIQVSKKSHLSASKKCQSKIVRSHFGQPRKSYWLLCIYPKISYTPMIYIHPMISYRYIQINVYWLLYTPHDIPSCCVFLRHHSLDFASKVGFKADRALPHRVQVPSMSKIIIIITGWGPQSIAFSWFIIGWFLWFMVDITN